jgi:CheY-like chemotaxis protein
MGVHLPDMNGMEATALIRRKQADQGIYTPIIGLVSDDEKDECRWCLKAGMDGVVLKPIDQRTLLKTMDQVVADATRAALNPGPGPGRKELRVPAASAPGKTTD